MATDRGKIYLENISDYSFGAIERYETTTGYMGVYVEYNQDNEVDSPIRYILIVSTNEETFTDIYPIAFKGQAIENLRILAKVASAKKVATNV